MMIEDIVTVGEAVIGYVRAAGERHEALDAAGKPLDTVATIEEARRIVWQTWCARNPIDPPEAA